jgi:hypothetical protein
MFPQGAEKELIMEELAEIATELNTTITPGYEGMQITL